MSADLQTHPVPDPWHSLADIPGHYAGAAIAGFRT
jgi:hypothetical protein